METVKKFKLTDEFITLDNRKLYRIEALKDFSNVKKGDKGGFVESEKNLSQYKDCWIYDNAKVYGNTWVFDNAKVKGYAKVYGNAKVFGDAWVFENAEIYGNAKVFEDACVFENAEIYGNAMVYGDAEVFGNAMVYGEATIYGNARIGGGAYVYGSAKICGAAMIGDKAKVYGSTLIYGNAMIYGDAVICVNARVYGEAEIKGNAMISNCSDYIVFKNWWSSGRYFTWTRSNNMWAVGCFYGTGEELIAKAYKDSELSGREYKKAVKYVESILRESNTTTAFNKVKQCLTKFLEKFKLC